MNLLKISIKTINSKNKKFLSDFKAYLKDKKTIVTVAYWSAVAPFCASVAYADGGQGFDQVKEILAKGVMFLGGVAAVWGLIQLGMNLRESGGGGGGQLSGAIGWIVGGALIFAAGMVLQSLDLGF